MGPVIGGFALGLVVLVVVIKWVMQGRGKHAGSSEPDIDYDELAQAEREVRELDSSVSPDEADEEIRDWGPGAPG